MSRPPIREMVVEARKTCGCPSCHWSSTGDPADHRGGACLAAHVSEEAARRLSIDERTLEAELEAGE